MMRTALLLLCIFCYSSAKQLCGYVPPTFAWPLNIDTQGLDLVRGSIGRLHLVDDANDQPVNLDYTATRFKAGQKSHTQLHVDNNARADLESAYAFQLYIKPEGDGVFLHYKSHNQEPCPSSIISLKARLISENIAVELSNGNTTEEHELALGLEYKSWHQLAIGRNASSNNVTVVANGVEHVLVFGEWVGGAITKWAGQVRVGGSMDEENFISARMACLQLIGCENPLGGSLYDEQCSTGWPDLFPWDVALHHATPYKPLIVGYNPCFGCPLVRPCVDGNGGTCVI